MEDDLAFYSQVSKNKALKFDICKGAYRKWLIARVSLQKEGSQIGVYLNNLRLLKQGL